MARRGALVVALALLWGSGEVAAQSTPLPGAAGIDGLLDQFRADAPEQQGSVRLSAWIEENEGTTEVVVLFEPEGKTKLVADPGITVTPTERSGVEWLIPSPVREVDPTTDYFTPPAMVRLPVRISDGEPVEVRVEYAYCVIDFQCFFGEETLTVATR